VEFDAIRRPDFEPSVNGFSRPEPGGRQRFGSRLPFATRSTYIPIQRSTTVSAWLDDRPGDYGSPSGEAEANGPETWEDLLVSARDQMSRVSDGDRHLQELD